jgi:hypothetical protein
VSAPAPAAGTKTSERDWWLRTLAVLQAPHAVFAALRDDSEEAAEARSEPVLALVLLAGIAGILYTGASRRFLDEPLVDDSLAVVAVLVFFAGSIYGTAAYWAGGALVHLGLRGAGGQGSYRRARHIVAFAAAPLVLNLLLVWPVRLIAYGGDWFRSGGSDTGAGRWVFEGVSALFALWALGLLVYGISVVERWTLTRALVSLALVVLAALVITLAIVIPLSSG